MKNNVYDKIKDFTFNKRATVIGDNSLNPRSATTIFKLNNYIVLGGYSKVNKTYSFYKFNH